MNHEQTNKGCSNNHHRLPSSMLSYEVGIGYPPQKANVLQLIAREIQAAGPMEGKNKIGSSRIINK